MKVLVFYTHSFSYTTATQNLSDQELTACYPEPTTITHENTHKDCLTAFIQVEEDDEQYSLISREKKLVNHLKWVARKNNTQSVLLHSFAHLSNSKASLEFTSAIFKATQARLENGGFEVAQTPFGYFLNFQMDAPGFSTARIWAEL